MTTPFLDIGRFNVHPALADVNDVVLTQLAEAACNAVENYLQRAVALQAVEEITPATRSKSLFLTNYPVAQVQSVRYGQLLALTVRNDTPNIQSATVEATSTGLTLVRHAYGTKTSVALTYLAYPTLGIMADGINALGNNWVANLNNEFVGWSSNDLVAYPGAKGCVRGQTAKYTPHFYYLSDYQLNDTSGELVLPGGSWNGHGIWSYRIAYTAGFDPIPEEIQVATVELAAATLQASKVDANLVSESLGGYSYTRAVVKSLADLSSQTIMTLRHFRRPHVPHYRVP